MNPGPPLTYVHTYLVCEVNAFSALNYINEWSITKVSDIVQINT